MESTVYQTTCGNFIVVKDGVDYTVYIDVEGKSIKKLKNPLKRTEDVFKESEIENYLYNFMEWYVADLSRQNLEEAINLWLFLGYESSSNDPGPFYVVSPDEGVLTSKADPKHHQVYVFSKEDAKSFEKAGYWLVGRPALEAGFRFVD